MKRALLAGTVGVVALAAWFVLREDAPEPEPTALAVPRPSPAIAPPMQLLAGEDDVPPAIAPRDASEIATALVTVTDAQRRAIPGAEVVAHAGGVERTTVAGPDGRAVLVIDPGEWRLTARAPGFVPASSRVALAVGTVVRRTFVLETGSAIRGVVVTPEGVPLAGAKVDGAWTHHGAVPKRSAVTATDGAFVLEGIDNGARVTLRVTADAHPVEEVGVTAPDEGVRVVMRPSRQVRVHVKEPNGQPAIGCFVSLFPAGTERSPGRFRGLSWQRGPVSQATGADGVAQFVGVAPGAFVAYARREVADGGDAGPFGSAKANADQPLIEVEIRLAAGFALNGNVVDDSGAPVEKARVAILKGAETLELETTEADGRFASQLFAPAPWEVRATAPGHESARGETGGPSITLVVKRLPSLTGRVVDGSGVPVTKFQVNDVDVAAADGRFSVPPRHRARKHEIEVEAPGFAALKVTAREGSTEFGDVVLQRGRGLEVTVVDAATHKPIVGAVVRGPGMFHSRMVSDMPSSEGTATDARGVATLDTIGDGSVLQVSHAQYVVVEVPVPAGATAVRVALEGGATLRLRVPRELRAGAIEATRYPDARQVLLMSSQEQSFRLAAGKYALRVLGRRPFEQAREVQLSAGREAEVVFGQPQGVPVEVQVVPPPTSGEVLLIAGEVAAPTRAQDWAWLSQIAAKARPVDGVASFPAFPPGRATVFVTAYPGFHRAVVDVAAGRVQVAMPPTLPRVPVE